jgi:repressor LexA
MNKFGVVLRNLRKSRGLTQGELGKKLNLGSSTISMYEKGLRMPDFETKEAIADFFNVSIDTLYGRDEPSNVGTVYNDNLYHIPLFENVSAGFGAEAHENIVDYIPLYIKNPREASETLCIKVIGDSMLPKIKNGDVIVVHKQDMVESGDVAVLSVGGEAVVKKVIFTANTLELHSFNPSYPVRVFNKIEASEVRILGKVLKKIEDISEDTLDEVLLNVLTNLTPEEELQAYAFIAGLKANRKS